MGITEAMDPPDGEDQTDECGTGVPLLLGDSMPPTMRIARIMALVADLDADLTDEDLTALEVRLLLRRRSVEHRKRLGKRKK